MLVNISSLILILIGIAIYYFQGSFNLTVQLLVVGAIIAAVVSSYMRIKKK
jgi:hypothetical protein